MAAHMLMAIFYYLQAQVSVSLIPPPDRLTYFDGGKCGYDQAGPWEIPSNPPCLKAVEPEDSDPNTLAIGSCSPCFGEKLSQAYTDCLSKPGGCQNLQEAIIKLDFFVAAPKMGDEGKVKKALLDLVAATQSWAGKPQNFRDARIRFELGKVLVRPKLAVNFPAMSDSKKAEPNSRLLLKNQVLVPALAHFGIQASPENKEAQVRESRVFIVIVEDLSVPINAFAFPPFALPDIGPIMFMSYENNWIKVTRDYLHQTFLHELGHAFGLIHIHDGLFKGTKHQSGEQCGACTPKKNSWITGDFIADTEITPSEFESHKRWNAAWDQHHDPGAKSDCGFIIKTGSCADVSAGAELNLMAYTDNCKSPQTSKGFTFGQLARMRCTIDSHLSAFSVPMALRTGINDVLFFNDVMAYRYSVYSNEECHHDGVTGMAMDWATKQSYKCYSVIATGDAYSWLSEECSADGAMVKKSYYKTSDCSGKTHLSFDQPAALLGDLYDGLCVFDGWASQNLLYAPVFPGDRAPCTSNVVRFKARVNFLPFKNLAADKSMRGKVEDAIQAAVAHEAANGVTKRHVYVKLSPGPENGFMLRATVATPTGQDPMKVAAQLQRKATANAIYDFQKFTMYGALWKALKEVEGIKNFVHGHNLGLTLAVYPDKFWFAKPGELVADKSWVYKGGSAIPEDPDKQKDNEDSLADKTESGSAELRLVEVVASLATRVNGGLTGEEKQMVAGAQARVHTNLNLAKRTTGSVLLSTNNASQASNLSNSSGNDSASSLAGQHAADELLMRQHAAGVAACDQYLTSFGQIISALKSSVTLLNSEYAACTKKSADLQSALYNTTSGFDAFLTSASPPNISMLVNESDIEFWIADRLSWWTSFDSTYTEYKEKTRNEDVAAKITMVNCTAETATFNQTYCDLQQQVSLTVTAYDMCRGKALSLHQQTLSKVKSNAAVRKVHYAELVQTNCYLSALAESNISGIHSCNATTQRDLNTDDLEMVEPPVAPYATASVQALQALPPTVLGQSVMCNGGSAPAG